MPERLMYSQWNYIDIQIIFMGQGVEKETLKIAFTIKTDVQNELADRKH